MRGRRHDGQFREGVKRERNQKKKPPWAREGDVCVFIYLDVGSLQWGAGERVGGERQGVFR